MSDKEDVKIDELAAEVKMINLTLQGDKAHGIEGLIPMLQRHMKESNENFKTFKRDIALDYVNDINDLDGRLKPIEIAHKKRYNTFSFFAGGGLFFGGIISNFDRIIKWFTE